MQKIDRVEYYRRYEAGEFDERRVELVDGVIHPRPRPTPLECVSMGMLHRYLMDVFPFDQFMTRCQCPLQFNDWTELEPDFAIVKGSIRGRERRGPIDHPNMAELVVEISETTLKSDRTWKARYYAGAMIPEYWIVNLVDTCVEIFQQPQVTDIRDRCTHYSESRIAGLTETIRPMVTNGPSINVADFVFERQVKKSRRS